ncbi:hypothetical protein F3Y22_tig00110597pilonHSYRG00964 [Hibiscus syriacus]|uniref:Uncharacterized protein n=1 Tax=Hibiscus syriacus TaxID=106335 RepID=A0A6A3A4Q8_HIBSY|nr:uncharacterized protein LOC120134269 [Hibiscus syriacus]KAE8698856.1 hypothetical protein F3Y22_tig00110597pilonHSYRG00964 [Hibiscus syriacus]
MAIEVLSGISSPRISFSDDLDQNDGVGSVEECRHRRLDTSLLNSSSDFDFCFENYSYVQELPTADELFSNGKILPIEIKRKPVIPKQAHRQPDPASTRRRTITTESSGTKRLKEFLSMSIDADDKPASKSFWQFKRSSSLNCESSRSKSLIRSIRFLTRSNSTGSAPIPKETQKHTFLKQPSLSRKSSVSSSSSGTYYSYGNPTQKPSCGAHGSTGVRVSPVLNLPHPIISNVTVSFFGFGSLFCNGKVKKKKR